MQLLSEKGIITKDELMAKIEIRKGNGGEREK
jgi:hypothetical protein